MSIHGLKGKVNEMTKIICDYCGEEIKKRFKDYRGDLDSENLAIIEVKPILLNQTHSKIDNPDLCIACIIEVIRQS